LLECNQHWDLCALCFTFSNAQVAKIDLKYLSDSMDYIYAYRDALKVIEEIKLKNYSKIGERMKNFEVQVPYPKEELIRKVDSASNFIVTKGIPKNSLSSKNLAEMMERNKEKEVIYC